MAEYKPCIECKNDKTKEECLKCTKCGRIFNTAGIMIFKADTKEKP